MPSSNSRNTLTRQWELIKRIPGHAPGETPAQLTQALQEAGFAVTKRTVERDLINLKEVFPALECNDKGKPHGWYWHNGAAPSQPIMTLTDALSLRIIEETLTPLLPATILATLKPRLEQARKLLDSQKANHPISRWADKVRQVPPTLPLIPPVIDPEILETIQNALLNDKQIDVKYQSMGDEAPRQRTLHPLALVQSGPVTYLVAADQGNTKIYALHRFHQADLLPDHITKPDGFDIDRYIADGNLQFSNGKTIKFKARITEEMSRILSETPLSKDQQIKQTSDEHIVTATVADSWLLRRWIFSNTDSIEVIGPVKLRESIINSTNHTASLYNDND